MSAKRSGRHFAFGVMLLWFFTVQALVPSTVTYQGYLSSTAGQPLDETVIITFTLYDATGGGNAVWTETHTVAVTQGLFSVALGSAGTPLTADLLADASSLGVKVGDDPEMTPRRALSSVAFSLRTGEADSLQGASAADLDQSGHVASVANPHAVTASQVGAASGAVLAELAARLDAALATITALQQEATAASAAIGSIQGDLAAANATIAALQNDLAAETAARTALTARVDSVEGNSVLALDGKLSLIDPTTAQFSGVIVQIVSGAGDPPEGNP